MPTSGGHAEYEAWLTATELTDILTQFGHFPSYDEWATWAYGGQGTIPDIGGTQPPGYGFTPPGAGSSADSDHPDWYDESGYLMHWETDVYGDGKDVKRG